MSAERSDVVAVISGVFSRCFLLDWNGWSFLYVEAGMDISSVEGEGQGVKSRLQDYVGS